MGGRSAASVDFETNGADGRHKYLETNMAKKQMQQSLLDVRSWGNGLKQSEA